MVFKKPAIVYTILDLIGIGASLYVCNKVKDLAFFIIVIVFAVLALIGIIQMLFYEKVQNFHEYIFTVYDGRFGPFSKLITFVSTFVMGIIPFIIGIVYVLFYFLYK